MNLSIDTTDRSVITLRLDDIVRRVDVAGRPDQQLLSEIDRLLQSRDLTITALTSITVNAGPGSFTGTRVGVAVANGLGLALGIPVNGNAVDDVVVPVYASEPHITVRK